MKTNMETEDIQKQAANQTPKPIETPKRRELILDTDGANVNIAKNEWSNLELMAGLSMILNQLQSKK